MQDSRGGVELPSATGASTSIPGIALDQLTVSDLAQVRDQHDRFWGDRDLRAIHLSLFVREFAETAIAARHNGELIGYLIGFVTPSQVGYVHLIASRDDVRGLGVARSLWQEFAERAGKLGATELKAITSVDNTGSAAFHRSIGFDVEHVEDFGGPGRPMVVFRRSIAAS